MSSQPTSSIEFVNSSGSSESIVDQYFKLDSPAEEIELFKHSWGPSQMKAPCWQTRFKAWEDHINIEMEMKGTTQGLVSFKGERIAALGRRLTVLDSKLGMALTFNSLLLVGVNFLISRISDVHKLEPDLLWRLLYFGTLIVGFCVVFLCLLNLLICLRGIRRIVWGDLGRSKKETLAQKEAEYVGYLIVSVARRTNMFRISTYITVWALKGLLIAAVFDSGFITYNFIQNNNAAVKHSHVDQGPSKVIQPQSQTAPAPMEKEPSLAASGPPQTPVKKRSGKSKKSTHGVPTTTTAP